MSSLTADGLGDVGANEFVCAIEAIAKLVEVFVIVSAVARKALVGVAEDNIQRLRAVTAEEYLERGQVCGSTDGRA